MRKITEHICGNFWVSQYVLCTFNRNIPLLVPVVALMKSQLKDTDPKSSFGSLNFLSARPTDESLSWIFKK